MRLLACVYLLFIPQYLFAICDIHIQNPSGQDTIAFPTNDFDTCADLAKTVRTENSNQEIPDRAPWVWSHYVRQSSVSAQMYLFSTQRNSTFGSGGFSITEEPTKECSERDDILFPHAIPSISPAHCFSQCEYLSRSSSEPGSEKALVYEPTGEACVDGDSSGSGGDSGGSDCGGGGAYAGNPIKVGPSNKIQQETDFDFSYKTSMPFTRTYNSNLPARGFLGSTGRAC
ncbi:hypothetical protein A9Q99_11560 [Gammaproteobacteria bacterium 45_16_T64]|nr:hypothetical protein A9Q99_11560 [Gammaproteobacteria bacterium 45_16_T64]